MRFFRGCIGIDLGHKTIKAAYMVKTCKGWIIENLLKVTNPVGRTSLCENKEIEMMGDSLSEIREKLRCKRVVMGVPNRHTAFRNIYLPKLKTKELKEAIYWEFQEFASVFHGEFVSDYHIVEEQPDYYRVFLAGVEKKHVMGYIKAVKRSGMNLLAVDAYPLAIERLFRLQELNDNTAVLDMGLHDGDLTILEKGSLYFARHIPIGTIDINKYMTEAFSADEDQSEAIKLKTETQALSNFLTAMVRDILQFFHYYALQTKGRQVEKLILAGEGSKIRFLQELLQMQLNIPVLRVNDIEFMLNKSSDILDIDYIEHINAIGFAMRG